MPDFILNITEENDFLQVCDAQKNCKSYKGYDELTESFNKSVNIIDFHAEFCPICRKFYPIYNDTANHLDPALVDNVNMFVIRVDELKDNKVEILTKYDVTGVPTVIALGAKGQPLKGLEHAPIKEETTEALSDRYGGPRNEANLMKWINEIARTQDINVDKVHSPSEDKELSKESNKSLEVLSPKEIEKKSEPVIIKDSVKPLEETAKLTSSTPETIKETVKPVEIIAIKEATVNTVTKPVEVEIKAIADTKVDKSPTDTKVDYSALAKDLINLGLMEKALSDLKSSALTKLVEGLPKEAK